MDTFQYLYSIGHPAILETKNSLVVGFKELKTLKLFT